MDITTVRNLMEIMWVAYDLLDTQRSDKVYKQWEYMADKKKKRNE